VRNNWINRRKDRTPGVTQSDKNELIKILIIDAAKANELKLIACSCFVSKIQKIDVQQDNFKFQ